MFSRCHTASPLLALLFLGLLAPATAARAEFHLSSDVVVPYFEVDLEKPARTTLFAVSNALDPAVSIQITVHSNWGIPVLSLQRTLKRHEVATVNLRDWLVAGLLPDRTLTAEEIAHLQAALSGQRSPQDQLYYSTEIVPERAVGYVRIKVLGHAAPDALWGDYFIIDPSESYSQGETLVNIDPGIGIDGICKRHAMRFLEGGAFSAGTEILVWTDRVGHPSTTSEPDAACRVALDALAYDELGAMLGRRGHSMLPVELIPVSELSYPDPFGWLDLTSDRLSFVSAHFSADGRYSSALHAYCLPERAGPGPAISLEKLTNGQDVAEPPGPTVPLGAGLHWTYIVTNSGDTPLTQISVVDDQGVEVHCPQTELAAGEAMTCTAEGTAQACQYSNLAIASGQPPSGDPVSARDLSFYYGSFKSALTLEKRLNGARIPSAPGPTLDEGTPILWSFTVTNAGEVRLTGVAVSDSQGFAVHCPKSELEPAEAMTCTANSTAQVGAIANLATATGLPPCGDRLAAEDRSYYTGRAPQPAIGLLKLLNGALVEGPPGPTLPLGTSIAWTYRVRNDGNTPLLSLAVIDDTGLAVTCAQTTLAVGGSVDCSASESARACAQVNHATATAQSPAGAGVNANATSWYTGAHHAAIHLVAKVEGNDANTPPGPTITAGNTVHWTYVVQNSGDVRLTGIVVNDDHGLVASCPQSALEPAETMTCAATSVAASGQQSHLAKATGLPPCGDAVSDQDPAYYKGCGTSLEGCSHGFWKNHTASWPATGYSTSQRLDSVFVQIHHFPALASTTLLQALSFGGGSDLQGAAEDLLKQAVAALLNAAHPNVDFPRAPSTVVADVNNALASGSRSAMLDLASGLDADNNLGCPLD